MPDEESSRSKTPKLQPEISRGGSGRPPRKTALGYFSEDEDDDSHKKKDNLKYGQKMVLKILAQDIYGYRARINNTSVEAILNTDKTFQINILITAIFKGFNKSGTPVFLLSGKKQADFVKGQPVLERFRDANFDFSKFKYKRKSDAVPMSFGTNFEKIDFEDTNIRRFITQLSEPNFHGCVKFSSLQLLARGYLIMVGGRCVGAEYATASDKFEKSSEKSVGCILDSLATEDAVTQKFNLSREIAYSLSSPFWAEHSWDLSGEDPRLVKGVLDDFKHGPSKTGMIEFRTECGFSWALFFTGRFIGFFNVENQTFKNKIEVLDKYLESSKVTLARTHVVASHQTESLLEDGINLVKLLDT